MHSQLHEINWIYDIFLPLFLCIGLTVFIFVFMALVTGSLMGIFEKERWWW